MSDIVKLIEAREATAIEVGQRHKDRRKLRMTHDRRVRDAGRESLVSALNVSSFIWGIADDVLRDVYVRGKYRDVILPMTIIRRLDAVLEPTKEGVLRMKEQLDQAGITNQDAALHQAAGEAFYNTSPFRLRDLTAKTKQQQLRAVLNGDGYVREFEGRHNQRTLDQMAMMVRNAQGKRLRYRDLVA